MNTRFGTLGNSTVRTRNVGASQWTRWLLVVLLSAVGLSHAAQAINPTPIEVASSGSTTLAWSTIGLPSGTTGSHVVLQATHGAVTLDANTGVTFTPAPSFSSQGHDRFEIATSGASSGQLTVLVVAREATLEVISSFEEGELLPESNGTPLTVGTAGALVGSRGISLQINASTPLSSGAFDNGALGIDTQGSPKGNGSSGEIHVILDDPPDPGESSSPTDPGFWSLFGVFDEHGNPAAEVRVGADGGQTVLQGRFDLDGQGTWVTSDPNTLPTLEPGLHRLRLDVSTQPPGRLRVAADDRTLLDFIPGAPTGSGRRTDGVGFGHLSGVPNIDRTVRIDHLRVARDAEGPAWNLVLADDFDAGLGAWAQVVESGGTVSTFGFEPALHIDLGTSTGWAAYLWDPSFDDATEIATRFTVNTTLLTMTAGDQWWLLSGNSGSPGATNLVQLRLQPVGDDFELRAETKDDSGTLHATAWQPLPRGEHLVELRWRASTPESADGYVRLGLNGAFADEVTGLANSGRMVEALRLGALGIDPGSGGTLILDDFVSWQD